MKGIKLLLIVSLMLLHFIGIANAGLVTNLAFYKYTIIWEKIELSSDNGETFTTVYTGPGEFTVENTDDVNSKVSDIFQDVTIAAGTYTTARLTYPSSDTDTVNFEGDYAGSHYYTSSSGLTTNQAQFGDWTFTRNNLTTIFDFAIPVEIIAGDNKLFKIFSSIGLASVIVNDDTYQISINVPASLEIVNVSSSSEIEEKNEYEFDLGSTSEEGGLVK